MLDMAPHGKELSATSRFAWPSPQKEALLKLAHKKAHTQFAESTPASM